MRIVLVDAEIAGYGASGRNGGWLSSGFPVSPTLLAKRFGATAARDMLASVRDSIDEIEGVIRLENIDAGFAKGGALRIARGRGQVPALSRALDAYDAVGLAGNYQIFSAEDVKRRVRVARAEGALFTINCATLHPGKLVRGLARAVERMGATIYEQSPIIRVEGRPRPRILSREGCVDARTVVLAGEAYLTRLPRLRRSLLPVYSAIILTEPLPDELWAAIGWEGHECISSNRLTVDYLSRTPGGRILFGSRGAPYYFRSRISPEFDHSARVAGMLRSLLIDWFPMLADVRVTHSWAGPVGMPRDWMPSASYDPATGIATARGYTGQGVATSNLAGRILAHQITGTESTLTRLPMANHRSPPWEPEPLRWLAVRYIQDRLRKVDEASERSGRPPSGRSLAERLARH
jgi:glycine/D-amino acid oxidase-like deaminating enzyme